MLKKGGIKMNKKDALYLIQKTKKFRECFVKQPGLFKVD